eukprot:Sspe_Gene.47308::Locus_24032_Transcript_1_1_Confidence_1.000_Length_1501::g.47308::m.47308/K07404/pgl; 6-phosphogluconolactonase
MKAVIILLVIAALQSSVHAMYVYVGAGGYDKDGPHSNTTAPTGHQIFIYKAQDGGKLDPVGVEDIGGTPKWMFVDGSTLITTRNDLDAPGKGRVASYAIDPTTGKLTFRSEAWSGGENCVYVSLHPSRTALLTANYNNSTLAVLPYSGGVIHPPTQIVVHTGSGPLPRQSVPHPHMVAAATVGGVDMVIAPDLGADTVFQYTFHQGRLMDEVKHEVAPASGPRHFVTVYDHVYVVNEIASTLSVFSPNFTKLATMSVLPEGCTQFNKAAEILTVPGKGGASFLYISNRGNDTIASFRVSDSSPIPSPIAFTPTHGWTRFMTVDPTVTYLYAANENEDTIAAFKVDRETGSLDPLPPLGVAPSTPVAMAFYSP